MSSPLVCYRALWPKAALYYKNMSALANQILTDYCRDLGTTLFLLGKKCCVTHSYLRSSLKALHA